MLSTPIQSPAKRLEYIDAMRGFTMLLVVYSHVLLMGYGNFNATTYNSAFMQFRMPLFFFISGFVLYKAERVWDCATCRSFIAKKFMVQIVPTLFFLLVFDRVFHLDVVAIILSPNKYGYWFTITLFEYFLMYVAAMRFFCIGGVKLAV